MTVTNPILDMLAAAAAVAREEAIRDVQETIRILKQVEETLSDREVLWHELPWVAASYNMHKVDAAMVRAVECDRVLRLAARWARTHEDPQTGHTRIHANLSWEGVRTYPIEEDLNVLRRPEQIMCDVKVRREGIECIEGEGSP